jgi:Cu-Zn family superoxide dismutase
MRKFTWIGVIAITTLSTAGCVVQGARPLHATATLEPRSGSAVKGLARLTERRGVVRARVEVEGLAPNSVHGFHLHEKGDCSAPDASSAGGHFNPGNAAHGRADAAVHHAGDLPSLVADAGGRARVMFEIPGVTLTAGPTSIIGRSFVIHRDADDFTSQPAGNSGPRVACGVVNPG